MRSPVPSPAIEPPATEVHFPDPRDAPDDGIVAVGSDFRAGTLLGAYRRGIFPWPHSQRVVPWCSPDPRAIFPLEQEPHWSRSLRRTLRRHPFEVTFDRDFPAVIKACGDERPDARWIIPKYLAGFVALHELGWTHSVEVWEGEHLVGGIYGIAIGSFFAGESMFHRRTDASKIAFATLVQLLQSRGFVLFDVQVMNPHLESLGCLEIERDDYLDRLSAALATPAQPLAGAAPTSWP